MIENQEDDVSNLCSLTHTCMGSYLDMTTATFLHTLSSLVTWHCKQTEELYRKTRFQWYIPPSPQGPKAKTTNVEISKDDLIKTFTNPYLCCVVGFHTWPIFYFLPLPSRNSLLWGSKTRGFRMKAPGTLTWITRSSSMWVEYWLHVHPEDCMTGVSVWGTQVVEVQSFCVDTGGLFPVRGMVGGCLCQQKSPAVQTSVTRLVPLWVT